MSAPAQKLVIFFLLLHAVGFWTKFLQNECAYLNLTASRLLLLAQTSMPDTRTTITCTNGCRVRIRRPRRNVRIWKRDTKVNKECSWTVHWWHRNHFSRTLHSPRHRILVIAERFVPISIAGEDCPTRSQLERLQILLRPSVAKRWIIWGRYMLESG